MTNTKRDAAAKEFFIERYNGNGSFKVLNAEPNVVHATKITINGVTMPAYTYFHVIEKSARDAEVAELREQLESAQMEQNHFKKQFEEYEMMYNLEKQAALKAEQERDSLKQQVETLKSFILKWLEFEESCIKKDGPYVSLPIPKLMDEANTLLGREKV
jgi:hypothetical protein